MICTLKSICMIFCICRTDEYFDRVYKDLEVFAHHAGRKTIDEKDAELLLKRFNHSSNMISSKLLCTCT